jgi:lycopene beta-cyclase
MISKNKYDYIICGAGASGLLLSYSIINDNFFNYKKILVIEKDVKDQNDKTFGFWENKESLLDKLVFKEWEYAEFKDSKFHNSFLLKPFKYKMIKSSKFYSYIGDKISNASNFTYLNSNIKSIDQINNTVKTDNGEFQASIIFSSIYDDPEVEFKKYPLLKQHFIGWTIETENESFDDNKITFMDFSVDQKNEIRFMYILPFTKNKALVEYTLFSKSIIDDNEYEKGIENYLKENHITDYTILDKEKGLIPMTCYPFFQKNTDNYFKIGTAGGWTKPSTGYTVKNSLDKIDLIINCLKKDKPLSKINFKNRFWYYDLLFLDVLIESKGEGSKVFSDLFKNNDPIKIFKFLDEKTSFGEELSIFLSVNTSTFVKSLIKRISNLSI